MAVKLTGTVTEAVKLAEWVQVKSASCESEPCRHGIRLSFAVPYETPSATVQDRTDVPQVGRFGMWGRVVWRRRQWLYP